MASGLPWTLKPEHTSQGPSLFSRIRKVGTRTSSKRKMQDASGNDPIIISDNDKEDPIVRLSRSWNSSSQKKIVKNHTGKPPCKECGITKEQILCFLELSQPHLPPDLPFSEKSMDSLELKTYLCAIHNHVVNAFNTSTTTKFSTLKEDLNKTEYQACKECGIHQAYISVLLNWSRSYLTNDDCLFDRMIYGTNDKRDHGKDTEDKERHQFMLRMYFGAITAHVENPFSIDDQSSEDDASEDGASEDGASEDGASEDGASEDNASEGDIK